MQITAWLKRHEGRPGVAQSSMSEQLVDVPVTSSREAEAAAYEVGWCRQGFRLLLVVGVDNIRYIMISSYFL